MTPFNTYGGGWMVVGVKKNSLEIYNNIHITNFSHALLFSIIHAS